ncbi:hypothetical protein DFS34DRAFT_668139 [Phlyctochytrium arcticum]|nr:hypothetical protein DFS34DRAFT_668139 [Phlyctochytrium arcticum]
MAGDQYDEEDQLPEVTKLNKDETDDENEQEEPEIESVANQELEDAASQSQTDTPGENELVEEDEQVVFAEETKHQIFAKTFVEQLLYSTEPIEYPPTSPTGVAIVYDVLVWTTPKAAFANVQYSTGSPGGSQVAHYQERNPNLPGYQNVEYVADEIKDMSHMAVDPESPVMAPILAIMDLLPHSEETAKYDTKKFFAACRSKCCPFVVGDGISCTGKLIIKPMSQDMPAQLAGLITARKFLGCSQWAPHQNHYYHFIKPELDMEYLERLIPTQYQPPAQRVATAVAPCKTIMSVLSKQRTCLDLHKLDDGDFIEAKMVRKHCPVKFIEVTPIDEDGCPYLILISTGVHNHPPPPPSKLPTNIRKQIEDSLAGDNSNMLKARNLIGGKFLQTLFGRGTDTLAAHVHPALNDLDIRDVEDGVYLRRVEFTAAGKTIIVCGLQRQIEGLLVMNQLQMDMTYKGIVGEFNEWELAFKGRGGSHRGSVLAGIRIYTDGADAQVYCQIFELVNAVCKSEAGRGLKFRHIHTNETKVIDVIIGDLDQGQAKGLGLFLAKMTANTTGMTWQDHLLHVFKSCQVHFFRNVETNAAGKARSSLRTFMKAITSFDDPASLDAIFGHILSAGRLVNRDLEAWTVYYKQPHVIGSLNAACSQIPRDVWRNTSDSSNRMESLHADQNRDMVNTSLLNCICARHDYDRRRWLQVQIGAETGVEYKRTKSAVQLEKDALANRRRQDARAAAKQASTSSTSTDARDDGPPPIASGSTVGAAPPRAARRGRKPAAATSTATTPLPAQPSTAESAEVAAITQANVIFAAKIAAMVERNRLLQLEKDLQAQFERLQGTPAQDPPAQGTI